jgi:hypothetical protein
MCSSPLLQLSLNPYKGTRCAAQQHSSVPTSHTHRVYTHRTPPKLLVTKVFEHIDRYSTRMSHTPPTIHCRAQRHALEYYSTGASTMVIPNTMLSEVQEHDWAACYNELDRWHTPEPGSVHEQGNLFATRTHECDADVVVEKGKSRPVVVYTGSDRAEGAKLWTLKGEKNGVCTGCGGKRVVSGS